MSRMIALLLLLTLTTSCDENRIIYVAGSLANCEGNASKKCLQVKENKEDEWMPLNQDIEGLEYKEGVTHKIEVNRKKTKNPSTNGSQLRYKLIRILYQEKTETTTQPIRFEGKWQVSEIVGIDSLSKSPTLTIDNGSKKISGNAGCNNYSGSFSIDKDEITFQKAFATKRYCTNMNIEHAFFNCLQNSHYYKLIDGKLKIYDKDGSELFTCVIIK